MESVTLDDQSPRIGSPLLCGGIITITGFLLSVIHIYHGLLEDSTIASLIGVYIPLLITVVWMLPLGTVQILAATSFTRIETPRRASMLSWMSVWALVGIAWMMVTSVGAIIYELVEGATLTHTSFLVTMFGTYGVIPGTMIGYLYNEYVTKTQRLERQRALLHVFGRLRRHNTRNNANVVTGNLQLIQTHADDPDVTQYASTALDAMDDIVTGTEKERVAVDALLTQTTQTVDITIPVSEAVAHCEDAYPDADITVNKDYSDDTVIVKAHTQIARAFQELIENAIIHPDATSPSVTVTISSTASHIIVDVAGNGTQIPESELVGFQHETSDDELEHASGVGLHIVDVIVSSVPDTSLVLNPSDTDAAARVIIPRAP